MLTILLVSLVPKQQFGSIEIVQFEHRLVSIQQKLTHLDIPMNDHATRITMEERNAFRHLERKD